MKLRSGFLFLMAACVTATSVQGGTKEELVRLQHDVLALQNQIREFDKSYSEKLEGLKSLVVQLNDQSAQSGLALEKIVTTIERQASSGRSADQGILEEIRNLSIKIEDVSTKLSAIAQQIADLRLQAKALSPTGAAMNDLSPETIYDRAAGDLVRGNYELAIQGFMSYLKSAPTDARAPNAHYGIAEAYYYQGQMRQAIVAYSRILTDYPQSELCASALYKRAKAELAIKDTDNAIADLKEIIERYPSSPEANLARTELQSLGVKNAKPPARDGRKPTR